MSIHAGDAVAGDDGNLYLLHGPEIFGINPAGQVITHLTFDKPLHDLVPVHLKVSAGEGAVWLRTPPRADGHFETTYLVVDLSNKTTVGWYSAPAELTLPAMGFTRNGGFEFLQHDKTGYHLSTAQLR